MYAKGGLFCFATAPRGGEDATASMEAASPRARVTAAAAVAVRGGGGSGLGGVGVGGGGGGGGGTVFESLPIHSGTVMDFRVNPVSRCGWYHAA